MLKQKLLRYPILGAIGLLAAALPGFADYSSTVQSFNPAGYWRLNETTPVPADVATNIGSLGATVNGSYVGSVTHPEPGALTASADTAAGIPSSGRITIPWNAAMNPPGAFTVECWANGDGAGGNHTLVQSMIQGQNPANANDRTGWNLREVGADLQFVVGTATGAPFYYYYTAVGAVVPGVYQHMVVVYDGAQPTIFVDGVQQTLTVTRQDTGAVLTPAEVAAVRVVPNVAGPTIIGERGYGGWNFNGSIDEVAIYGTALSVAQVQAHHQNGISASPSTPYQQLVLADGPVAYYRLNEPAFVPVLPTALNSGTLGAVGNGTYQLGTATLAAGPPYAGLGANNYACQFNGSSGYIDCGSDVGFDVSEISIAAWVKATNVLTYMNILAKGGNLWRLNIDNNSKHLAWVNTVGDLIGKIDVVDGQWHHVVAVAGNAGTALYVDGKLDVASTASGTVSTGTDSVYIGSQGTAGSYIWQGWIDEVALFGTALTASQVAQIYQAAQVPPVITQQPQSPTGAVYEGMSLTLQVSAVGNLPLAYQWTKNAAPISGKTASSLVMNNLQTSDSGNYAVVITNIVGAVTSSVVALTVQAGPPIIVSAPQSATRYLGGVANFSATVLGSVPMTLQWLHGTTVIPGATTSTLALTELQPGDAGAYTFRAINALGTLEATFSLTLVTATKVAAAVIDKAPLGYWQMNEASGTVAYDSWGLLNGSLSASGVTNNVAGPVPPSFQGFETTNKAYALNGTGGFVSLPSFGQFSGAMTIIAWIKPSAPQSSFAGLVFTRGGGGGTSGLDFTEGDQLGYHWNDAAASYNWRSALVPVADQWNFVALVVEPTQATIYLDAGDGQGIQAAVNTLDHGASTWTGVNLGSDSAGGRFYKGSMDDVAVYNYSFTAEQIAAIRNAGVANTYTPTGLSFVSQPQSQTVIAGNTATFSASVTGSQPISYQWQKNGANIPGAIRKTLSIPGVYYTDAGAYSLRATNSVGGAGSASATLTVMPAPEYAIVTNDLVLHLKFDGNYQDVSGRGNNGTPMGALPGPTFVAGKIGGNAVHVDSEADTSGSNPVCTNANYVTLGAPADLEFGTDINFSVAYWVKLPAGALYSEFPMLCNSMDGTFNPGLYFGTTWTTGGSTWWLGGVGKIYESPANSINDGNWHHLVFTFDRMGDGVTYLDGVKVDSRPINNGGDVSAAGQVMNIGQDASGTYPWFGVAGPKAEAVIDDMGIWRRALNSYEALSIYNAALNGLSFDTGGPIKINVSQVDGNIDISWQGGTLKQSTTINGTYTPVPGAVAPFHRTSTTGQAMFYKVN